MPMFMKMFFYGEVINMWWWNCVCIATDFRRNFTYFGTRNYEECYLLSSKYRSGYTSINIWNYSNTDQLLSFLLTLHRDRFILCNANVQNWVSCIHVCLYDKRADVYHCVHIMWVSTARINTTSMLAFQHKRLSRFRQRYRITNHFHVLEQKSVTDRFPFKFDVGPSLSSAT
jgi:hypothetical protein